MANYTTKENVEKYLSITFSSAMATYVSAWLNAVDAWIENYIGRSMKDIGAATKYYDTYGGREIYVDEFEGNPTTVQTLDADGDAEETLTVNEDYRIYPYNKTGKNLLIAMENGRLGEWPVGDMRLKITANFGRTTIPADITLAATKLVATIAEKSTKGGQTQSEAVGDTSFSYKTIDDNADALGIYNILNSYRFPTL